MKELVLFALQNLYGLKEHVGNKHQPFILKIFSEIGHSWVKDDETAWCSAVHCWIHKQLGYAYTGKLNARSWENFGQKLSKPELGCTVVFWRVSPESGYGHVGFYIREDEGYIYVLGGNQSDQYNISRYEKTKVLSYRQISKL